VFVLSLIGAILDLLVFAELKIGFPVLASFPLENRHPGSRRIQASRPPTEHWQLPLRTLVGSTRREPLSRNCAI
jgi:hypothetical protein